MTNKFQHMASLMQPACLRGGASAPLPRRAAVARIGNGQQRDRTFAGKECA